MNWEQLLIPYRSREGQKFEDQPPTFKTNFLTNFSRDPDRVLFSSAFRRLQGKAQVYIFPPTDFVRNRLTHSLEVSSIGRNLIAGIYKGLTDLQTSQFSKSQIKIPFSDLSDIVAAACLAHDLGNPPFGHIGEYAIRSWFKENLPSATSAQTAECTQSVPHRGHARPALSEIEAPQRSDFELFDGNAQSFRMVTKLQNWGRDDGGLRLTAATLGALVKYPNTSSGKAPFRTRKFGIYDDDKAVFEDLANVLGLKKIDEGCFSRHPFAFITEAADDIAYLTSDIEDARKFGLITWEEAEEALLPAAQLLRGFSMDEFLRIEKGKVRLKFLRSTASLAMIHRCVQTFIKNEGKILSGEMRNSLLSDSSVMQPIEQRLRAINEAKIYHVHKKIKAEAGAYEIIRSMLTNFSDAIENKVKFEKNQSERSQNLLSLIDHSCKGFSKQTNPYDLYLGVVDYISGMTDRYAVDIFETLCGRKLTLGY